MARDSKGGRDHHPARFTSYIKDPHRDVYVCEVDSRPVSIIPLKVIYHPLYSMNNFVTNKSKLPQDGAQVFPYMG